MSLTSILQAIKEVVDTAEGTLESPIKLSPGSVITNGRDIYMCVLTGYVPRMPHAWVLVNLDTGLAAGECILMSDPDTGLPLDKFFPGTYRDFRKVK